MNENMETFVYDAADAFTGAQLGDTADTSAGMRTNEALDALLEGFMQEESDWPDADKAGPDSDDGDDGNDDDLMLVAEPEDGEPAAAGIAAGKNTASGTAGGENSAPNDGADPAGEHADASVDGTAGKTAAAAADGAAQAAEQRAAETALQSGRPGEEPRYKVQIAGREQEMSVSELVAAAQRGLDSDRMRAELNAAQQALPALRMVEQYAAANGMTAGQYLQLAGQNIHRQAVKNLTQKGVPEETAREIVDERIRLEAEKRAIAPMVQRMNAEEARKKARDPWLEMTREYPDVTNLPDSVLQSVQRGETPLAAMRAWELEQLRAKLSAQELQLSAQAATLKNRHTAPGSAAGAANTKRDPFLEALFGND